MNEMSNSEILNEKLFEEIEKEESANIDVIKELIEKGADINCIDRNTGNTPIICAFNTENTEIIELLFSYDELDINKENLYGKNH